MFSDCSDEELAKVMARSAVLRRDASAVLVTEGDPGTDIFDLLEGKALVTRHGEQLPSLAPGDLFGKMAGFDSGVRAARLRPPLREAAANRSPPLAEVIGTGTEDAAHISERLRLSHQLPGWNTVAEKTVAYTLGAEEPSGTR